MAAPEVRGYFYDPVTPSTVTLDGWATVHVQEHAHPVARNSSPGYANKAILPVGGDVQTWKVRGFCERANRGDAEQYAIDKAAAFLSALKSRLGITRPIAAAGHAYGDLWFQNGTWEIKADVYVLYDLVFVRGTPKYGVSEPAYDSGLLAAAPATNAGRTTSYNWTVTYGGNPIQMGSHCVCSIRASRDTHLIPSGRAYGIRVNEVVSGKEITGSFLAHQLQTNPVAREEHIEALSRLPKGDVCDLTGNGNTWSSAAMLGIANQSANNDENAGSYVAKFALAET